MVPAWLQPQVETKTQGPLSFDTSPGQCKAGIQSQGLLRVEAIPSVITAANSFLALFLQFLFQISLRQGFPRSSLSQILLEGTQGKVGLRLPHAPVGALPQEPCGHLLLPHVLGRHREDSSGTCQGQSLSPDPSVTVDLAKSICQSLQGLIHSPTYKPVILEGLLWARTCSVAQDCGMLVQTPAMIGEDTEAEAKPLLARASLPAS